MNRKDFNVWQSLHMLFIVVKVPLIAYWSKTVL